MCWGQNRKKLEKIKNVVCVISRAALSSSLHSFVSRFDELLLGAAFDVVAVTVLTIIIESVLYFASTARDRFSLSLTSACS
jgi:hypothetical protein